MALDASIILAGNPGPQIDVAQAQQRALQTFGMQQQAQERIAKAKEQAEAKKANEAIAQLLKDSLIEKDGVWTYDRERIMPLLGALPPEVAAQLDAADKHVGEVQKARSAALAQVAALVDMTGNNPVVFEAQVERAVKNGLITQEQVQPYLDAIKADPTKVAAITGALTGKTPPQPGQGDFTLNSPGAPDARFRAGESKPYATGLPPTPKPDEPVFRTSPDKRTVERIGAIPAGAHLVQAPQPQSGGSSSGVSNVNTGKMPPQAQTVLGRLTVKATAAQRVAMQKEAARLAAAGNEDELKSYLAYSAVETEPVARQSALIGRMETMQALSDAEKLLKEVPTGFIAGTWEDTMRKLGTTSDPRLVELGTRMGNTLANYMRSISGAAIADQEASRLSKLLPNYSNSLPVNMGVIKGMKASIQSFDDAFYKHKFGDNLNWVLGGATSGAKDPMGIRR